MEFLQFTATLPGGSGQWKSCNALPCCLRVAGSGTCSTHRHNACGQWAVEILQCTATLLEGSGRGYSCSCLPHCLCEQWSVEILQCTATQPVGRGHRNSCSFSAHCPWAIGGGIPAIRYHAAWGHRAVELLQCTTTLAWGQWAVELLQCTATPLAGSGQ